jgi:hypothetical protein
VEEDAGVGVGHHVGHDVDPVARQRAEAIVGDEDPAALAEAAAVFPPVVGPTVVEAVDADPWAKGNARSEALEEGEGDLTRPGRGEHRGIGDASHEGLGVGPGGAIDGAISELEILRRWRWATHEVSLGQRIPVAQDVTRCARR